MKKYLMIALVCTLVIALACVLIHMPESVMMGIKYPVIGMGIKYPVIG